MSYAVILTPAARAQLLELDAYLSKQGSPQISGAYVDAIIDYCASLATFPLRGTRRDDIRPGVRITHYRKRAVIAFTVDADAYEVMILGVFYGGQDYDDALSDTLGA